MMDVINGWLRQLFLALETVPDPGSVDPLITALAVIVIVAMGLAGILLTIIWPAPLPPVRDAYADPFGDIPQIPARYIDRSDRL